MPVRALILATLLLASQSSNSQAFPPQPAFPANQAFPIVRVGVPEAPVGHRQPTLNDLPPWLRQQETTGSDAGQADQQQPTTDGMQRREQAPVHNDRAPPAAPADGVPRICNGC